jgi:hypothetical protein
MPDTRLKLLNEVQRWTERANEARASASTLHDVDGKRALLEIAEGYDRLAQRALAQFNELPQ